MRKLITFSLILFLYDASCTFYQKENFDFKLIKIHVTDQNGDLVPKKIRVKEGQTLYFNL